MLKFILPAMFLATLTLANGTTAGAGPRDATAAASPYQSASPSANRMPGGLLRIRDVNGGGSGRSSNGCWTACFSDFDECMGIRTKNHCVSRVKTCLETCDRLANRPGM